MHSPKRANRPSPKAQIRAAFKLVPGIQHFECCTFSSCPLVQKAGECQHCRYANSDDGLITHFNLTDFDSFHIIEQKG